jgi:hypothetical protein
MAAKEISVKKYVVRLSGEERERLETLIRKGKSPACRVLKARILLKADVSEAEKGGATSGSSKLWKHPSMVYRVRKQLVEEGFEAVLSRKPRAMPAVARIFDGRGSLLFAIVNLVGMGRVYVPALGRWCCKCSLFANSGAIRCFPSSIQWKSSGYVGSANFAPLATSGFSSTGSIKAGTGQRFGIKINCG